MKKLIFLLCLLPMFAWAGDATLSWTAPTQNTDGSALTDLAGYKIYAGLVQGGPYGDVSITINNPTTTTFVVPGLAEGTTYFFVTTAFNSASPVQESDFSNEVSKLIPALVPMPPTMLTVQDLTVYNVIKQLYPKDATLELDFSDEINDGAVILHAGECRSERIREAHGFAAAGG